MKNFEKEYKKMLQEELPDFWTAGWYRSYP